MKTKQGLFFGFAVFALAAIFILAGCSSPTGGGGFSGDAETPVLGMQPLDLTYGDGDSTAWPLFVIANVTDGGSLSYQWFSNTVESTEGGTYVSAGAAITPPIPASGPVYYYVVVTNTNYAATGETIRTATSRAAKVEKVNEPVTHAVLPTISGHPQSGTYTVGETASLSVTASGGSPTYQWFSNTANNTDEGTLINGATGASYTPPTTSVGTVYYYVIVTNTDNNATGTKVRTVTSNAAAITVSGGGGGGGGLDSALVAKWYAYPTQVDNPDAEPLFEIDASGSLTSVANTNGEFNVTTSGGTISATVTYQGETYGAGTANYAVTGNRLALSNPMLNGAANEGLFSTLTSALQFAQIVGDTLGIGADGYYHKFDPSNPFMGTWTGGGYTLIMTAATWEIAGLAKGVYARTGNAATLTQTIYWWSFGGGSWMPEMGERPTYAATIMGTTMTATIGGTSIPFTKEAGNAAAPTISVQPEDATYGTDATAVPLTVTASADGGSLSYQWYRNTAPSASGGILIDGKTADTYTPPITTDGTLYYYVVVTNTSNGTSVTSRAAKVEKITGTVTNAATPAISVHPQGAIYGTGDTAAPLTVTADPTDGGTLSYQWYRNTANNTDEGTLINGATQANYTPSTATAGTVYYYVMVINTNNNVNGMKENITTSDVATITVNSNAATPTIYAQPQDTEYIAGAMAPPLSVTATIADAGSGGTLTYQWFSNTTPSTIAGTSIDGATLSTYMPSTAAPGTGYYYVIVTNTNNNVNGTKTMTATSRVATVTVNDGGGGSNPFVGTWTESGVTLTVTASGWEVTGIGPDTRGTYTPTGVNTAVLTPTYYWTGTTWTVVPSELATPYTVTVSGDKMTGTYGGTSFTLTKNGGGGGSVVDVEKTLVITDIPASVFTPETTDQGKVGIFLTDVSMEDILQYQEEVATAGADFANGDVKIEGTGPYTLNLPLYHPNGSINRWTGNGKYNAYIVLNNSSGAHYYSAGLVTFSDAAPTATILFSSANELVLPPLPPK
jgi:hypothetical protein